MANGKVVVICRSAESELSGTFLEKKPAGFQVVVIDPVEGDQKLAKEMGNTQTIVTLGLSGRVRPEALENAKQLKLIQTAGQDTGHLPVKWALEKGVFVANGGGANAIAVAEFTTLLMLSCLRNMPSLTQSIKEGNFRGSINRKSNHELYDRTVGIVGFGNIGRRVAHLCSGYGANIIYYERMFVPYALRADTKAKPVSLDELLAQSDIVSLHVPSFSGNRSMIGWEQLNKMKPTAYLINTSRGANIDEAALVRALNEKKIAGAGLDVWDPEPPKPDNPLLHMANVVATPHSAGLAWENWGPSVETVWRNIVMVSEGKDPLNRIREF